MVAEIALPRRDFKEVLAQTNELLAGQPAHARGRLLRAAANTGLGNYMEARVDLTKLIKEQPKYIDAQLQLAALDLVEKKFKDAEDGYRKLYVPGQADTRPLEGLVTVMMARNQSDEVNKLLNEDLKKSSQSTAVRILLARVAVTTGKYNEGISHIQAMLKERPDNPELTKMLGEVYLRKGDWNQAISTLQGASKLLPKDPAVILMLANAQELAGRKQEAIGNYRRLLELQGDNPIAMNNLAFLIAETGGDLDEALKLAQRALEKNRDQPAFSDTLGWVYLKKNMHDSALQIFTTLVTKDPGNAGFQYHLGMTYLAKGDKTKARDAFTAALSKKPPKDVEEQIQAALAKLG
jgi:Flp pilus assembly protein TadD